ncbi:MAG TPA: glycosyltransferase [Planktothrix sp.]|jgi:glycosyltransferase involved in cell wall biosynthesis
MNDRFVSVVLPVHNQADHIGQVLSDYVETLQKFLKRFELVVVLNGCSDNSKLVCEELARKNDSIVVIESAQAGWGAAVKCGLERARGEVLCYTNSARTSSDVLARSIEIAVGTPEMVVKVNRKIRENWRRRLGSLLYNLECRALFDLPTWDINGTPKVFPRSCSKLLSLRSNDDLIDAEFNMVCKQANYSIVELPAICYRRHGGKSTTNYMSALKMYVGAYRLWKENRTPANS